MCRSYFVKHTHNNQRWKVTFTQVLYHSMTVTVQFGSTCTLLEYPNFMLLFTLTPLYFYSTVLWADETKAELLESRVITRSAW